MGDGNSAAKPCLTNAEVLHYIGTEGLDTIAEHGFSCDPIDQTTKMMYQQVRDAFAMLQHKKNQLLTYLNSKRDA